MQRAFTKTVGRFKRGEIRDYPGVVWTQIAKTVGEPLGRFTADVQPVVQHTVGTDKPSGRRKGR